MDAMCKPTGMCLWRALFRKDGWALGWDVSVTRTGFFRTYIEPQAALSVPRALGMIWLRHAVGALSVTLNRRQKKSPSAWAIGDFGV